MRRFALLLLLALGACGDNQYRDPRPLETIYRPGYITPKGNYRPGQYRLVPAVPVRVVRR